MKVSCKQLYRSRVVTKREIRKEICSFTSVQNCWWSPGATTVFIASSATLNFALLQETNRQTVKTAKFSDYFVCPNSEKTSAGRFFRYPTSRLQQWPAHEQCLSTDFAVHILPAGLSVLSLQLLIFIG